MALCNVVVLLLMLLKMHSLKSWHLVIIYVWKVKSLHTNGLIIIIIINFDMLLFILEVMDALDDEMGAEGEYGL